MKYEHFISLGYFCSPALELERLGYRDCSSPFDWLISDFNSIEKVINNNFDDFLNKDNLYQILLDKSYCKAIYKDIKYGFEFYHDFSKYKSLEEQIDEVKEKYLRRIKRFYLNISEPTLFIRYISSEKGDKEICYIEENYLRILQSLKKFNQNNDIIFIANDDIKNNTLHNIYYVTTDKNDKVARMPFEKNLKLKELLASYEYEKNEENLKRYNEKNKKEKKLRNRIKNKIKREMKRAFLKEYIHYQQYDKDNNVFYNTLNKK